MIFFVKCKISAVSSPETTINNVVAETESPAPICQCIYSTHIHNSHAIPTVVGLLSCCRPSAIRRLVVSGVVNAFNGMIQRWLQAHIGNEVLKLVPPFTYRDSPSSVTFKTRDVWIAAPSFHSCPRSIFRTVPHPVSAALCLCNFSRQASTRFSVSVAKIPVLDSSDRPTIALAEPHRGRRWFSKVGNHRESSESASSQIMELLAVWKRNWFEFGSVIHGNA